ncbi:zymogen granule membrane protein 16-like [Pempheris klunzingeri]|uniref:zymogen granule membrane protein 16-like n=1 Tax=Pempheris klunzingeri TaxID=3127111 RepID=UPI003980C9B3
MDRMFYFALLALLAASAFADVQSLQYSFSPSVGSGSGKTYSLTGAGRITAVRVWEVYSSVVYGIQFRFGYIWSDLAGTKLNEAKEIELFDGETIVQISGKYRHYLQSVVFTTSRGRTLSAGQPAGLSFNMYPTHSEAELIFISGRAHGAITAIEAHWGVVDSANNSTAWL